MFPFAWQCASVSFIDGSAESPGTCRNASSVSAEFSSDSKLKALAGSDSETSPTRSRDQPAATQSSAAKAGAISKDLPYLSGFFGLVLYLAALA